MRAAKHLKFAQQGMGMGPGARHLAVRLALFLTSTLASFITSLAHGGPNAL